MSKQAKLNIIQISDLHFFSSENQSTVDLRNEFLEKINIINRESQIDLLIINGDVFDYAELARIYRNSLALEGYISIIKDYISKIENCSPKAKIIVLPGNHDFLNEELPNDHHEVKYKNHVEKSNYISSNVTKIEKSLKLFKRLVEDINGDILTFYGSSPNVFTININEINVRIVYVYSSMLCGGKNNIEIDEYRRLHAYSYNGNGIDKSLMSKDKSELPITIGITHHSSHHFHPMNRYGSSACFGFLYNECDIILSGHDHPQFISDEETKPEIVPEIISSAMNFNISHVKHSGFNQIKINKNGRSELIKFEFDVVEAKFNTNKFILPINYRTIRHEFIEIIKFFDFLYTNKLPTGWRKEDWVIKNKIIEYIYKVKGVPLDSQHTSTTMKACTYVEKTTNPFDEYEKLIFKRLFEYKSESDYYYYRNYSDTFVNVDLVDFYFPFGFSKRFEKKRTLLHYMAKTEGFDLNRIGFYDKGLSSINLNGFSLNSQLKQLVIYLAYLRKRINMFREDSTKKIDLYIVGEKDKTDNIKNLLASFN